MSKSVSPVLNVIDHLRGSRSRRKLALDAGLSADFFSAVRKRGEEAGITAENLKRIAKALDIAPADLLGLLDRPLDAMPEPRSRARARAPAPRIPVLGVALGATIGGFKISERAVDSLERPSSLADVEDAYALYVEGRSMSPKFEPGDVIVLHPGRPCLPGDTVAITLADSNGTNATYLKQLVSIDEKKIVAQQITPPQTFDYVRKYVRSMHHVMTLRELLR